MRSAWTSLCRHCPQPLVRRTPVSRLSVPQPRTSSVAGLRGLHAGANKRISKSAQDEQKPTLGSRRSISFTQHQSPAQTASVGSSSAATPEETTKVPTLASDDLFHSFTNSPIPEIRHRAAFMRQHARCPHHDHQITRVTQGGQPVSDEGSMPPANVDFECPDCGIPVYCSREHWAEDYENHLQLCDTLRQINEDDHDLRSGRLFPEFEYAGPQMEEALVNMSNWDTFLYTRGFEAVNSDRSMRQVTRLLTYPVTIGSVLHELSPYSIRKGERLTVEGLKSFSGMSFPSCGSNEESRPDI